MAKPIRSRSSGLVRNLSDDEDTPSLPSHTQPAVLSAPSARKPHLVEFEKYLQTVEHVGENMSTVSWWGVSAIISFYARV